MFSALAWLAVYLSEDQHPALRKLMIGTWLILILAVNVVMLWKFGK